MLHFHMQDTKRTVSHTHAHTHRDECEEREERKGRKERKER